MDSTRTSNPGTGRMRARVAYPTLGKCERCKTKNATDRHHKDGDTFNNIRANVAFLCRKCHMEEDGRLGSLAVLPRPKHPSKPCAICGTPSNALRKSRCHRCNEYFRRNGAEWAPNSDHRFGSRGIEHHCNNCNRKVDVGWSKGRCPTCRLYFTKHGVERKVITATTLSRLGHQRK